MKPGRYGVVFEITLAATDGGVMSGKDAAVVNVDGSVSWSVSRAVRRTDPPPNSSPISGGQRRDSGPTQLHAGLSADDPRSQPERRRWGPSRSSSSQIPTSAGTQQREDRDQAGGRRRASRLHSPRPAPPSSTRPTSASAGTRMGSGPRSWHRRSARDVSPVGSSAILVTRWVTRTPLSARTVTTSPGADRLRATPPAPDGRGCPGGSAGSIEAPTTTTASVTRDHAASPITVASANSHANDRSRRAHRAAQ